jgi:hypothetical protein
MSATEHAVKRWSEMTPDEWEAYKREVDARRGQRGEAPIRWELFGQPQSLTDEDIAWARGVAAEYGLLER